MMFLNLVRAAEDRQLAVVEILRRGARRFGQAARRLAVVGVERRVDERLRVRPHRAPHQRRDLLADLRAANLQHRAFRARRAAARHGREHAQVRRLHVVELDRDAREPRGEERIVGERAAVLRHFRRHRAQLVQRRDREAHARDVGALVREQVFRVGPALVLFADPVLGGHAHVGEEHFVHFVLAVERDDRAHLHAGRIHVDEQEADAFLLAHVGRGAHEAEDHVRVMAERRPSLLAVDDVMIAPRIHAAHRARAHRREIRARARLRIALAPPVGAVENARQPVALLRRAAVLDEHGAEHVHAERHDARRARDRAFVVEQELLRDAPAWAAPFARPVAREPAPRVEDGVPFAHVVAREPQAALHLARYARRQLVGEKALHLRAERFLFCGEIQVHVTSFSNT